MNERKNQESDPKHHTANIKRMLDELVKHLREDVSKVDDPQAQALFEVSAEVLGGLHKAFDDYEQKNEAAWRGAARTPTAKKK
jgi:hypothetical protein